MRILLVNKFFHHIGGDSIHVAALADILSANGHQVALLTLDDNPAEAAFTIFKIPPVSFGGPPFSKLRGAVRTLWGAGANSPFRLVLKEFRPDVVHLHNIHSYLSPSLAEIAREKGIRVVWTLHDYKLICPAYAIMRGNAVCTECFDHPASVIRHKCMKGSLAASILAYAEKRLWNVGRLDSLIDAFICPSDFMRSKMAEAGFSPSRLHTLHNFITAPHSAFDGSRHGVVYIGRLSKEKGVQYLIDSALLGGFPLTVAGDGPLLPQLRKQAVTASHIRFIGAVDRAKVWRLLTSARLSAMPSICLENCPLSAIESLCAGTPVIASDIGALPELIHSADCGVLVPPADPEALVEGVARALSSPVDHRELAAISKRRFSASSYLSNLMDIYGN